MGGIFLDLDCNDSKRYTKEHDMETYVVFFNDTDRNKRDRQLYGLANKNIRYIQSNKFKLEDAAKQFFTLIMKGVHESHEAYFNHLLDFFHDSGYMLFKKEISKTREKYGRYKYRVKYYINDEFLVEKYYSCLKDIVHDTGFSMQKVFDIKKKAQNKM